jgi:hypothetical protein
MTDEPTPDDIERLLRRYSAQHRGEVDEARLYAVLENVWQNHPLREDIDNLAEVGAELDVRRVGEQIELWLGFPDDPERWPKSHGRRIMIGRFALDELRAPPQG